jgi:hypothetical protein
MSTGGVVVIHGSAARSFSQKHTLLLNKWLPKRGWCWAGQKANNPAQGQR